MSQYCGKCDCYDCLGDRSDEYLQSSDIYAGDVKLDIKNQKDLMPYYPFIIGISCSSNNRAIIHLTSKSYVDIHEEEILNWYLDVAKKEYRRCKRKKIPYDPDVAVRKISCMNTELATVIAKRVESLGNKANIDGLSLGGCTDYYRKQLYNDMIAAGYDKDYAYKWVYEKGNHVPQSDKN